MYALQNHNFLTTPWAELLSDENYKSISNNKTGEEWDPKLPLFFYAVTHINADWKLIISNIFNIFVCFLDKMIKRWIRKINDKRINNS